MKNEEIKVKTKREDGTTPEWAGTYGVPETLDEAVQKYGAEVVIAQFTSQLVTNVQNIARAALREGKDVAAAVAGYVPGQKRERAPADPAAAILTNFAKMDDEAKKAVIAQLRQALGR